jgi:ABC-type phosphate/phosphonate transport system substrate-binding protein
VLEFLDVAVVIGFNPCALIHDKPIYHAIVIARPELQVSKFPDDTKGKSISFADVGSTSDWLIPTYQGGRRQPD